MATLMIDGRAHSGEKPLKTVGDLVAAADDWLARSGRIVTELRLDGVDEPAFREPQIVGQSASDRISEVQIESGTRADLALRCLHEAGDALKSLAEAADSVADLYRLGEIAEANRELAAITDGIGTALAITGAASLGLGVDLGAMATSEGTLGDLTAATSQELQGLISAQLGSDWEGTADMLIGGSRRCSGAGASRAACSRRQVRADRGISLAILIGGAGGPGQTPQISQETRARPARNRTAHRQAVRQSVCFRDRERDQ